MLPNGKAHEGDADKLKDSDKQPLEAAIAKAREAAKGDNVDAIKSAITELEHASNAMNKVLYEAGNAAGAAGAQPGAGGDAGASAKQGGDDDVIDAEFEVKK